MQVGPFNQEKALVGAFSVIVQPVVEPMDRFAALLGMELPPGVRSLAVVEDSSTNTLLASISTALHLGHGPVKGQVGGGERRNLPFPIGFFVVGKRPIFRIWHFP